MTSILFTHAKALCLQTPRILIIENVVQNHIRTTRFQARMQYSLLQGRR